MAVRLKQDDKLMLKAFKEIPAEDIEKLLPQGVIKMGRFDRTMMVTSLSLTALGVLAKFVTLLANYYVNWTIGFAALTAVIGARGWFAYKNRQNAYLASLNKMLFFKNIANNRGLITLVVDRAEDESFKEALLTYTFIHSMAQLQPRIDDRLTSKPGNGRPTRYDIRDYAYGIWVSVGLW